MVSIVVGVATVKNRVTFSLLGRILARIAFSVLRTKFQLGYIANGEVVNTIQGARIIDTSVPGVRLITGLIARRIIPWVQVGDVTGKGERISLIQFGSRVDLYLPLDATVSVKLGDRVVGGETVVAKL